jgi:hypothetical protein
VQEEVAEEVPKMVQRDREETDQLTEITLIQMMMIRSKISLLDQSLIIL